MAIIDQYRNILTVLIEFELDPSEIQEHVSNIKAFINDCVRAQPGFISANVHTSLDNTKVINYAQWKSEEDYENFLSNPEVKEAGEKVLKRNGKVTLMKVALAT